MVQIPECPITMQDLINWYNMKDQLASLRVQEMLLRKRICAYYFPAPTEGTNTSVLPDGTQLKMAHKLTRTVDEALYTMLLPDFRNAKIDVDTVIKTTSELKVGPYKKLDTTQKSIFDQCVTMKVASPDLEIKPAKP